MLSVIQWLISQFHKYSAQQYNATRLILQNLWHGLFTIKTNDSKHRNNRIRIHCLFWRSGVEHRSVTFSVMRFCQYLTIPYVNRVMTIYIKVFL